MTIYNTLKIFWKTNKHNEVGWLLLLSLDKVVKKKDELRNLNSQLRHHKNVLKLSVYALKETLISSSPRAKIAENQM